MSPTNFRPLSLIVGAAYFMEQLDSTIIAPALPQIADAFQVDPLSLNLTMTVYLLCEVAIIPVSGVLAGRFGTRVVFKAALLAFAVSSLLCGLAQGPIAMTCTRALQGASAALLMPVGRTAIIHATPKADLVMALAWMITPAMLGPLLGPPLGGLIVTYGPWRWIFLINLPIGLIGFFIAGRLMPQILAEERPRLDVVQWMLLAVILVALTTMLALVRHAGADLVTYAALCCALVLAGFAYRAHMRRSHRTPLLDFALLRVPTFRVSFWGGSLVRVGYGALPFLLPLLLQLGLGFSALQSGLVLLASGAVAFVTKTFTARILAWYGFRRVLIWNGVFCALALALCATYRAAWSVPLIALLTSIGGLVRSVQLNALAAIAYADLPRSAVAPATSLNTTFQQLAVMFGISLSVAIVDLSARLAHRPQPAAEDYAVAFIVLALVALAAVPVALQMQSSAGRELSGHDAPGPQPTREG